MVKPYYISEAALKELKDELETLRLTKRHEIAERLKEAKAMGDLSENAEYQEAKEAQAFNEGRITELEDLIRRAVVIKKRAASEMVLVGSTVEVRDGVKRRKFTIVGPEEADPAKGIISNESPLGAALLGKRVREEAIVDTPGGVHRYRITAIF
ncbi:MAG: transcription elongation factor GreA [Parcubacteria group bacterium]|nr:transcription elongation factor GreA [Parcubacteria group bacterium]